VAGVTAEDPTPPEGPSPPEGPTDAEIRRRQRARALIMGVLLAAFVILVYAITIAKMSLYR
jgi:hypothetical protein